MINKPEKSRLTDVIKGFKNHSVLVVGDIMLDHFIWGKVTRISPEAPVPVVDIHNESLMLGGAANVLNNIVALGGGALLSGVIGHDDMGRRLVHELRELGVHTEGLIVEEGRPTTVKTRVIAHSQQVVRFDREDRVGIGKKTERLILEYVESHAGEIGGLIVSDYAKGVITARLVKELVALSEKHGFTVAVDPKVGNFGHYKGVTVLTPNNSEASQAAGIDIVDDKSLHVAGDKLLDKFKGRAVLITRGEHGMSLFERGKTPVHIPTVAKDVYDVTGAGDTVIAVFTLAMASGATMPEAAMIANQAAGIVVGEVGTATVGADELIKAIKDHK